MPKGGFWDDTFEQLAELGKTTTQKGAQAVNQTLNPVKILENALGSKSSNPNDKGIEQLEKGKSSKQNHTPLNFNKLQESYKKQDEQKLAPLRNRFFQLVKSGEERAIQTEKREVMERKRQETYEEQEKRRRIKERQQQEQSAPAPQGKQRRSIFSHKKVAQRQQAEVKPSSGKQ